MVDRDFTLYPPSQIDGSVSGRRNELHIWKRDNLILLAENSGFLEWLVGERPDRAGTPALQWANLPESWGVFVLLAFVGLICYGVFWMYRREIKTCPQPVKMVMAGIRLAVLLLLILLYLKPSLYFQKVDEVRPPIELLRDSSMSLARGDLYRNNEQVKLLSKLTGAEADAIDTGKVTRSGLLNQAFAKHPEILEQMRLKGPVRVVDFADGSTPYELIPSVTREDLESFKNKTQQPESDGSAATPGTETESSYVDSKMPLLVPTGAATDIWQALKNVLDGNAQPSSIVLISEGQHNGGEDPLEMAEKAASLDIPIYTIGIGDPNPPKNVSVKEIYVRNKAYPDEPFEVEAVVQTSRRNETDLPAQLKVSLLEQRVDAQGKLSSATEIKTQDVDVPEAGGRIRLNFDHATNRPGKYVYTVRSETLPDETDTDDNELVSSQLEVIDEKVKVLLISGLPSWDYQQVYKLLQRDQTIDLSCWLQSMDESRPQEGNSPITRLPQTIEELGQYNVVLMMDPDPREFDDRWVGLLRDFCQYKAGGVMFMAGPQFASEFLTKPSLKPFREIVPVRFGDLEEIEVNEALASATDDRAGRMLTVPFNMDHPVMSFRSEPEENLKIWNMMPGIYWSFPALRAKPTARVLMERGDQVSAEGNQPLLVSGRYGAGSVLYLGFQGTWRWRPVGLQAQFFDRFWIQVVRFLVETRSLQGSRRGFIDREKTEYELGQRVTLVARLLNEQFKPSKEPSFDAVVKSEDGREQTVKLKLLPNQEGRYEGAFPATRVGSYEATVKIGEANEDLIDPVTFRVVPPSAESGSYWLNEKLLREIADRSGGKYLRLDSIQKLPEVLPNTVERFTFNSPPEPLWDASQRLRWIVFLLPVVLLTIEWAVRKWYKLL
jgi:hypothetical protein